MPDRFIIIQDNDCHWYLIKDYEKVIFNEIMEIDANEITSEGDKWLEDRRINGPHTLTFIDPVI